MSLAIPEAVCPGRVRDWNNVYDCPRKGAVGKVNSIGLCPACSKAQRRAATNKNEEKAYQKEVRQDYTHHTNFLKMLATVDTLRGVLSDTEAQTIRTIVQRHLLDLAVELGDAPAGLDALLPQSAAAIMAEHVAKRQKYENECRQREEQAAAEKEAMYAAAKEAGCGAEHQYESFVRRCRYHQEKNGLSFDDAIAKTSEEVEAQFDAYAEREAKPEAEDAERKAAQAARAAEVAANAAECRARAAEIKATQDAEEFEAARLAAEAKMPPEAGDNPEPVPDGLDAEDAAVRKTVRATKAAAKRKRVADAKEAVEQLPEPAPAPELDAPAPMYEKITDPEIVAMYEKMELDATAQAEAERADWAAVCVLKQNRPRLPGYAQGAGNNAYGDAIDAGATRAEAERARFAAEDESLSKHAAENALRKNARAATAPEPETVAATQEEAKQ